MSEAINCPIKINLILRVLSPRPDGYHNISSVFWKKAGGETLTIMSDDGNCDILDNSGIMIKGTNLVTEVLEWARNNGVQIPRLHMKLQKKYPPGSGIGAGSGNAAAMITWIEKNYGTSFSAGQISRLGADVAVLAQNDTLIAAEGIGEKLTPFECPPKVSWVLAFPRWHSSTALAYRELDGYRAEHKETSGYGFADDGAVVDKLMKKERIGLLPNDFLPPAAAKHREYNDAFVSAEENGAAAWGLCGSGSALFALSYSDSDAEKIQASFEKMNWISQTERLE